MMLTVRNKITLLITLAGFLSSLFFSVFILSEMLEGPNLLLDAELESLAHDSIRQLPETLFSVNDPPVINLDEEEESLRIFDNKTGKILIEQGVRFPDDIFSGLPPSSPKTMGWQSPNGQNYKFRFAQYVMHHGENEFLIIVGLPTSQLNEERRDIVIDVVSGLVISTIILIVFSYFAAGLILRPLKNITSEIKDISVYHLDRRLPETGPRDEFNLLARTLNSVFHRLEGGFLKQKQLIDDASHELKTPLAVCRLITDDLLKSLAPKETDFGDGHRLHELARYLKRMERLVRNLLTISSLEKQAGIVKKGIDLRPVLDQLLDDYGLFAEQKSIRVETDLEKVLLIDGDYEQIRRLFSNLLDNAVKFAEEDGTIRLQSKQDHNRMTITVGNSGPGIPPDQSELIFAQFVRLESSRSSKHGGFGLGLPLVKRIAELHEATIVVRSDPGIWTEFDVSFHIPRY